MKKYVYSEAKEVVVCGDNYYTTLYNRLAGRLCKANNWVVFVRGNHDDPSYFNEEKVNYERFRCVPDYSVINVCGRNVLCVGGAVSIDRKYRRTANLKLERRGVASKMMEHW